MKKIALMTCAMLALAAGIASAQINLAWNDCQGASTATHTLTWACNANLTAAAAPKMYAVASFFPANDPRPVAALEADFHWLSDQATLVNWWQFGTQFIDPSTTGPNGCRSSNMVAKFDATPLGNGTPECLDYTGPLGPVGGSLIYYGTSDGAAANPRYGYAKVQVAVPFDAAAALDPATQTYATWLQIDKQKTVGGTACTGCANQVCITLDKVIEFYTDNGTSELTAPATSNTVTWQSTAGDGSLAGCTAATPTKSSTWGQLKSLYR